MFGKGNAKIISKLIVENAGLREELAKFSELIAAFRGTVITYSVETENAPGLVPVMRQDLEAYFLSRELAADPRGTALPAGYLEISSQWIKIMRKHWALESQTEEVDGNEFYDGRFMQ